MGQQRFTEHMLDYGLSYGTQAEFEFRMNQYLSKEADIEEINANPAHTFTVGHNQFSTWTEEEYKALLGYQHVPRTEIIAPLPKHLFGLSDTADWRDHNAVTKVKNQGQCGSCWAFSTTGTLEGMNAIADKTLLSYSEQQLVDCDTKGNLGCKGGSMDLALDYTKTHPLMLEADYPYKGKKLFKKCEADLKKGKSHNSGKKDIAANSVSSLTAAVAAGPVSIAIEADKRVFQMYTSGILNSVECGHNLDHGVLAVGYGADHFIVKNSWGATWGESGYVRISNSDKDICGILMAPV